MGSPRLLSSTHRNDAGEAIYFARQLEFILPEVYKVEHPGLMYPEALPFVTGVPAYAEFVTYVMWDVLGVAKIVANYADDLPRVDVQGKQFSQRVVTLGDSVGWNWMELLQSEETGQPIDRTKLDAAFEAIERLTNKLAFLGDSTVGLIGITTIPSMPNTVVPISGGATTWDAKIALGDAGKAAILNDLALPFTRMNIATKGTEVPDTLLIAPSARTLLSNTPRTTTSDKSIWQWFLDAHPGLTVIEAVELETSGTGGTRQMILYRRNSAKLGLIIPQDIMAHPPEARGLEHIVAVTRRYGGVQVKKPLSLDSSYGF